MQYGHQFTKFFVWLLLHRLCYYSCYLAIAPFVLLLMLPIFLDQDNRLYSFILNGTMHKHEPTVRCHVNFVICIKIFAPQCTAFFYFA
jgi:hypothetical protein